MLKICEDKSAAKFLDKPVSKMQHMHDFERKPIIGSLDAILDLDNLSRCIWPIVVSSL